VTRRTAPTPSFADRGVFATIIDSEGNRVGLHAMA
jgi:predicted enzyme related to lactoylglutathione lyase